MRLVFILLLIVSGAASASAQNRGQGEIPVETAAVTSAPLSERVTAVGSLISNESITARPEVAGRVVEIGFEEGQPVKKGDVLIKLDDALPRATVAEAEARLELAKRNFKRTEELFSNEIATGRSRDEARSNLDISTATVELAKVKLNQYQIIAPFDGIAGLRQVSIGDYISSGEDLFNLESLNPIKVDFRIPERFLAAIHAGQAIEISVDAYSGHNFKGEVYAIDPKIDAEGRSIVIRARIPNEELLLRPGLFARVALILEVKPKALSVPEQAIVPRGQSQFVFRVIEGKAKETEVRLGTRRGGQVEIIEGLSDGDVVVTAGQQKIRDGVGLKPIDKAADSVPGETGEQTGNGGKGA
jgi:membrane fusion protein (multidrug efflux system)